MEGAHEEDELSNEEWALFAETKNAKSTTAGRTSDLTSDDLNFDGLRASNPTLFTVCAKRKVDNTIAERQRKARARKKEALHGMEARCNELEAELEKAKARIQSLESDLRDRDAGIRKPTRHHFNPLEARMFNEDKMKRPGIKPMVMVVRGAVEKQEMRRIASVVNQDYCKDNPKDTKQKRKDYYTHRVSFGTDMQPPGQHRFMWVENYKKSYLAIAELKKLVSDIQEASNWKCELREVGQNSAGVVVLDSGDCWSPSSMCERCIVHKDFDRGRLNGVVLIFPLTDDVFGLPHVGVGGDMDETIVRLSLGDCIMMSTATYHFGGSHKDFDGSQFGPCRRRLFLYMDIVTQGKGVEDREGQVVTQSEVPIPKDYEVYIQDDIPNIKVGFHAMYSELSWLHKSVVVSMLNGITYQGRFLRETQQPHNLPM